MKKKGIVILSSGIAILVIAFAAIIAMSNDQFQLEQEAKQAFEEADYERSIELFATILEEEPLNINARIRLAESYIALAQLDLAEHVLLEGIELIPTEPTFYSYLAYLYINQSDILLALEILAEGTEYTSDDALKERYDSYLDNIEIRATRTIVQKDSSRTLRLVWSDERESEIPIKAEWSVDNERIGIIESSDQKDVQFAAKAIGNATVTAETEFFSRDISIEVKDQVVERLMFEEEELPIIAINEELRLTVNAYDANGEEMEINPNWSLENEHGTLTEPANMSISFTALSEGLEKVIAEYEDIRTEIDIRIDGENKTILTRTSGEGTIILSPIQASYPVGSQVPVEAVPAEGWVFSHWEGDLNGDAPQQTLLVEEHHLVKAVFTKDEYTLSVSKTGEGEILKSTLDSTIPANETVTLTARPANGWTFVRWTGDISSSDERLHIQMNQDYVVRAVFVKMDPISEDPPVSNPDSGNNNEQNNSDAPDSNPDTPPATFTLTSTTEGEGTISSDPAGTEFKRGTSVTLTAEPRSGWIFAGWKGSQSSQSQTITITMDGAREVIAVFEKEPQPNVYRLNVSLQDANSGSITLSPNKELYYEGDSVTISAIANEGWQFVEWKGAISHTNPTITITMTGDLTLVASFEKEHADEEPSEEENEPDSEAN